MTAASATTGLISSPSGDGDAGTTGAAVPPAGGRTPSSSDTALVGGTYRDVEGSGGGDRADGARCPLGHTPAEELSLSAAHVASSEPNRSASDGEIGLLTAAAPKSHGGPAEVGTATDTSPFGREDAPLGNQRYVTTASHRQQSKSKGNGGATPNHAVRYPHASHAITK